MIELPDDELDKLFRKSAEEFDPTFDPQDWSAMKKRLDEEDGEKPGFFWLRKWWPLLLVAVLFTAGTALYFGVKDTQTVNAPERFEKQPSGESVVTEKVKSNPVAGAEENKIESATKPENQAIKIMPRDESKASGVFLESDRSEEKSGAGAILSQKSGKGSGQSRSELNRNRAELVADDEVSFTLADRTVKESGDSNSGREKELLQPDSEDPESERTSLHVERIDPLLPEYNNPLSIGGPSIPVVGTSTAKQADEIKAPYPRFAVRLGISPDISSVQFMKSARVGSAVSLLGEYAVLRRLYVQAGVIRSVKRYVAYPGDYNWPGNWTQPVMPESVDAMCKIVELPINLRFDLFSNERNRWFAAAGTSSYQMKDEQYEYNYKKHVTGIKWYKWQGETGWYWFSHLNASVGYEYRLSKGLSLQAEPYVNIPIRKVGFGQVNLFTTGIWISLRYFPFQK